MKYLLPLACLALACSPSAEPAAKPPPAAPLDSRPILLCLGDSLTAGYGVAFEEAWPAVLQEKTWRLESPLERQECRNQWKHDQGCS